MGKVSQENIKNSSNTIISSSNNNNDTVVLMFAILIFDVWVFLSGGAGRFIPKWGVFYSQFVSFLVLVVLAPCQRSYWFGRLMFSYYFTCPLTHLLMYLFLILHSYNNKNFFFADQKNNGTNTATKVTPTRKTVSRDSPPQRFGHKHKHEHEYKHELKSCNKGFTCDGCKEQGFGSKYKCKGCNLEFHEECKSPKRTITHDFFPGCQFEFLPKLRTSWGASHCCDACGKDIHAYTYHCRRRRCGSTTGWDLHPSCSNLKRELCIDGKDFVLRDKVGSKCWWCKNKQIWGGKEEIPGWSYVSDCKKYHFHVYCVREMVQEAWKKSDGDEDGGSMALLKRMDLGLMTGRPKRNGGRGGTFRRTVRLLTATLGVLFGDPISLTISLTCTVVELLST